VALIACALILYGVIAWLGWALWAQLRTGRITWIPWSFRWPTIQRAEQPFSFLATIAGQVLGLFAMFVFGLAVTYAVLNPDSTR